MEKLRKALSKLFNRVATIFTVLVVACIVGNIMIPKLIPAKHIVAGVILCIVLWVVYFFVGEILDFLGKFFVKCKDGAKEKIAEKKESKAKKTESVKEEKVSAAKALKVEDAPSEAKSKKDESDDDSDEEMSDEDFWCMMYAKYKHEGKL